MKNVYRILGFLILGIILGNIGSRLIDSGIFVQWESLGSPPGGGKELAGTDGYRIFVRTKTDDFLSVQNHRLKHAGRLPHGHRKILYRLSTILKRIFSG